MNQSTKPSGRIETITPERATKYLERNICNRTIRPTVVERFANVILAGEFHLNGESIKFDENGNLMDGQHRLLGVEMAGQPIEVFVVRGLPSDVRSTIDVGARRTLADWLKMNGEVDSVNLSTAINWYYRLTEIEDPRIRQYEYPTYEHSFDILKANPGLRITVQEWRGRLNEVTSRAAMLCSLLYWFDEFDDAARKEFAYRLCTGEDLRRGNAILTLRRTLSNDRIGKSTQRTSGVNIAALVVKAFNYWRIERPVATLSWRGKQEQFPRPLTDEQVKQVLSGQVVAPE